MAAVHAVGVLGGLQEILLGASGAYIKVAVVADDLLPGDQSEGIAAHTA
jgi:hypothetical protein